MLLAAGSWWHRLVLLFPMLFRLNQGDVLLLVLHPAEVEASLGWLPLLRGLVLVVVDILREPRLRRDFMDGKWLVDQFRRRRRCFDHVVVVQVDPASILLAPALLGGQSSLVDTVLQVGVSTALIVAAVAEQEVASNLVLAVQRRDRVLAPPRKVRVQKHKVVSVRLWCPMLLLLLHIVALSGLADGWSGSVHR